MSSPEGPCVAVEYGGNLHLKHPEYYSDLFFLQTSRLAGTDVLLTFGQPRDPFDDRKAAQLREYGIRAAALHPKASKIHEIPFFIHRPRLASYRNGPVRPSGCPQPEWLWLQRQTDRYYRERDYWKDFFSNFKVKVYVSWSRFDERHYAIADALQELGGATVIYQRACQVDPAPEIAVNADIMFGYSPKDAEVERRSGSRISYHVAVGYFGDHRFPLLREPARVTREQIKSSGARWILAFFDENSGPDERWHTGNRFQAENYQFLLEKVLAEPWLGLVLKPKVPRTLRDRLGDVAKLLDRAIATGRCVLYEGGTLHGSHPPALAALSADLAIHGHLCAATAGLESALAGTPTLLLDREGWHVSPLYELGVGKVAFTDWPSLWNRVLEHWNTPKGIPNFGDWSPMLDVLDPFRDGCAAERMGTYIQWLIEGFKNGLDRQTVMANAAERYSHIWGSGKITELSQRTASESEEVGAVR
ncbi:MAG TPA: hypothetical protein VGK77_24550 [Candidatus Binatia bacterium]